MTSGFYPMTPELAAAIDELIASFEKRREQARNERFAQYEDYKISSDDRVGWSE